MTQALSSGFCAYCHSVAPLAAVEEWCSSQGTDWQFPVLQLVDIQLFTCDPDKSAPTRFYLILSDAKDVVWCVVPPRTELSALLQSGAVEVGTIFALNEYAVVAAKCGKNVIICFDGVFSSTTFSMIGQPHINTVIIQLSPKALRAHAGSVGDDRGRSSGHRYTERRFADLLLVDGVATLDPLEKWSVSGRVVSKSKLRAVNSEVVGAGAVGAPRPGGGAGVGALSQATTSGGTSRFVFDCIVVDAFGDAMKVVFWGSRLTFDTFDRGDCIRIFDGSVRRDAATGEPQSITVQDRGFVRCISEDEEEPQETRNRAARSDATFPFRPSRLIGVCAIPPRTVCDVLSYGTVGDVVTVYGIVTTLQPPMQVRTSRGMVSKAVVCLRDFASTRSVEVTLWDQAAVTFGSIEVGQLWYFRDVTVRIFSSTKQLSSRWTTEAWRLPQAVAERPQDLCLLYSLTTVEVQQRRQRACRNPLVAGDGEGGSHGGPLAHVQTMGLQDKFLLDLTESNQSETLFVLVKIQRVKLPLFFSACSSCGAQMKAASCSSCSSESSELKFLLRADITDGINVFGGVVGFAPVAEALFGVSSAAFLERSGRDPAYTQAAIDGILGLPVMVKLITSIEGVKHLVELRHVSLKRASEQLCDAIALYE